MAFGVGQLSKWLPVIALSRPPPTKTAAPTPLEQFMNVLLVMVHELIMSSK